MFWCLFYGVYGPDSQQYRSSQFRHPVILHERKLDRSNRDLYNRARLYLHARHALLLYVVNKTSHCADCAPSYLLPWRGPRLPCPSYMVLTINTQFTLTKFKIIVKIFRTNVLEYIRIFSVFCDNYYLSTIFSNRKGAYRQLSFIIYARELLKNKLKMQINKFSFINFLNFLKFHLLISIFMNIFLVTQDRAPKVKGWYTPSVRENRVFGNFFHKFYFIKNSIPTW